MTEIFLSRPTSIEKVFDSGLKGFLNLLNNLELNPRTLGSSDYPNKAPMDEVISLMSNCKGAIILGYPQIYSFNSKVKEVVSKDKLILPTEWNHIEASLAYSRQIPLLVIHHLGIKRGVFDRGALNCFVYEIDLAKPDWAIQENISGAIRKWKTDLNKRRNKSNQIIIDDSKPICPNCSTEAKRIYLSPIPKEFIAFENANYECTICKYVEMIK